MVTNTNGSQGFCSHFELIIFYISSLNHFSYVSFCLNDPLLYKTYLADNKIVGALWGKKSYAASFKKLWHQRLGLNLWPDHNAPVPPIALITHHLFRLENFLSFNRMSHAISLQKPFWQKYFSIRVKNHWGLFKRNVHPELNHCNVHYMANEYVWMFSLWQNDWFSEH